MKEALSLEIEERIKSILVRQLQVDPGRLAAGGSDAPLLGRGVGLDSVDALALVAGIEEEFDIQVDDADLTVDLFRNIATLAEYVLKKGGVETNSSSGGPLHE